MLRMLREPVETVRARAERLAQLVGGSVEETVARVGGGALPLTELQSFACAVEEELAALLRRGEPPVIAVVRDGRTCSTAARSPTPRWTRLRPRSPAPRMSELSAEARLWEMMRGALATRALGDRRRPRLAEALVDGPRPVTELAPRRGADADSLHRILRALASEGVFGEAEPGVFGNTEAVRAAAR